MPEKRKSGPRGLAPSIEVSHLARAHGITRDQARRLMNKIGNNRTKLDEAVNTESSLLATTCRSVSVA
jgi:hypothetical protein